MKNKITGKHIAYTLISGLFAFLVLIIPLPYEYEAPGKIIPAESVVSVKDGIKTHTGQFFITTVLNEQANVLLFINHLINPDSVMRSYQTGAYKNNTAARYLCKSEQPDPADIQTQESIYRAKLFALQKIGYRLQSRFEGVQVTGFLPGSLAVGILQPGDIITDVDSTRIRHQIYLHRQVNFMHSRKKIFQIGFLRNGKSHTADVQAIIDESGRASLGVYLQTYLKREKLPVEINIDTTGYSGSSAGLPIFLEILHQLKKEDMAKGMKIAASGSLDEFGNIRSVYGIRYKIKGAEKKGIKYFMCSKWNYEEAKNAASGITIIPVTDINKAVEELDKLQN